MFAEKTPADFEQFLAAYFPCYSSDWDVLADDAKAFLFAFLDSRQNLGFDYVQTFSDASFIATGLYDFAVCKDMQEISTWIRGDLKGNVVFAAEKQIDRITEGVNSDCRKLLELMETHPRAVSAFYIFLAYNYRVTEAGLQSLISCWKSDPSSRWKEVEDPEKGMKLEDYIRYIDAYFDAHPLRHFSYQFRKVNGKNVIEFSFLRYISSYKRSEMKYLIPVLEYADSHYFNLCTSLFMNDAKKTAGLIEDENNKTFGASWKYSLNFF